MGPTTSLFPEENVKVVSRMWSGFMPRDNRLIFCGLSALVYVRSEGTVLIPQYEPVKEPFISF